MSVLTSSDAEMQLCWAEDALIYADNCLGSDSSDSRPSTPDTERQIRSDAVNVVNFLAEQGHPKAEFLKGMWLEFGKHGLSLNKPEAFRAYKRAAAKGYARAEYRMGLQYESTNEPMKALQHYKSGEAQNDSASCYRIGMMSLLGQLGQTQDFVDGVRLVRFAADSADENAAQGAYVFGMLLAGELAQVKVPEQYLSPDQNEARQYIEKAAFLGFSKAQLKMGSAYELCSLGCPFDPALALHYMALAARQGEPEAEMAISKWFLCGYEGLFSKNNGLAYKYANRAAAGGLPTAEFAMGYFNEVGIYVKVDLLKAREWYESASQHGNTDAKGRLEALASASSQKLSQSDHENVALNRIRSQYGSQRGPRPQRFQNSAQSMPQISEQPSSTPQPDQQRPGRAITPYPVDDRPATVAPYPLEDDRYRPNPKASSNSAFFIADPRPSSAAVDGRLPPMPYRGPGGPGQMSGPYRQSGPPGRANPAASSNPNLRPPPQGQRMPSAGYRPQNPRSDTAPPGGRQSLDRPETTPPQGQGPPQRLNAQPPPRMGASPAPSASTQIGFSAPIDPRADQRNRPTGTAGMRVNAMNNVSSSPTPGYTRPPRGESRPGPGGSRPSGTPAPLSAPTPPPQQSAASQQRPGPQQTPASSAPSGKPARPPGKGPQTFDEMGVPPNKQDHDCVSGCYGQGFGSC